jgi:hypothetical protein
MVLLLLICALIGRTTESFSVAVVSRWSWTLLHAFGVAALLGAPAASSPCGCCCVCCCDWDACCRRHKSSSTGIHRLLKTKCRRSRCKRNSPGEELNRTRFKECWSDWQSKKRLLLELKSPDAPAAAATLASSIVCAYRRLHDPAAEKQASSVEAEAEEGEDDDERNDEASVDRFGVAFQSIIY